MTPCSLFITGTDTDAGKTVATAALSAAALSMGKQVHALKPLATGSEPPGDDAIVIAKAAGHAPLVHTCLPTPAAPLRAALEASTAIDIEAVLQWIHSFPEPVLVEGVGGWEVPLTESVRVKDLAKELDWPVVVVAANRLGVLNHTLLTVDAIASQGLTVAGVILNDGLCSDPVLARWNLEDLHRELTVPIVVLPKVHNQDQLVKVGRQLWAEM